MKYNLIFLNIKKLMKNQSCFFLLLILSQIVACLVIFFAVGAIHNTRNEQKDIDIRTMYFEAYNVNVVTDENGEPDYSNCELLSEFNKKAERVISIIPQDMLSHIEIGGIIENDNEIDDLIRVNAVYNVSDGFMISPNDIQNGNNVAAISKYGVFKDKNINDTMILQNKEFKIVSKGDYSGDVIIPLKSAAPELTARNFRIEFNSVPSKELADEINKTMEALFPSSEIYTPEIPDLLTVQFNRTMIIASLIIIAVIVINLSYCYCYLFMRRKRTIAVYMICGCSNSSAANLMVIESAIISFACYMISFCIMKPLTPLLTNVYAAAENLYSLNFFVIVGAVYITITVAVLKIMFSSIMNKSAADLKRGV